MSSVRCAAAMKSCSFCAIWTGCWPPSVSVVTSILRTMDFQEILRRRRMVRNYTDEPVDREAVERIVARGRKAPSGGFSQGLRLVVVSEEPMRRRIAELAQEEEYVKAGMEPWISRAPV